MTAALIRAMRSELVRLRRLFALPAAAVLMTAVVTALTFAGSSTGGGFGRGATSDGATTDVVQSALEATNGIVGGLDRAGTLVALLTLVLWALALARDLQTGSIRVLLVTEPRRFVYLAGKLLALLAVTAATVLVCVGASVGVATIVANARDISTAAWQWGPVGSGAFNLGLSVLLWGSIGAALAMTFRSSAAAIAGGAGYFLIGETLIGLVWSTAKHWLPAGSAANLVAGGSDAIPYDRSILLVLTYLAVASVTCSTVLMRRDVTD